MGYSTLFLGKHILEDRVNMKRICIALMLIVIAAAVCGCGQGDQDSPKNIVSQFSDIIKTYYIQKDTGTEELAEDMFSEDIYEYLSLKISDCRDKAKQEGLQKQNYTVKTKLLERLDSEDYKTLKYQVVSTFNYEGMSEDTTVSEIVYIVYDNAADKIVNFTVLGDYFDAAVRGITDSDISIDDYDARAFVMTDEIRSRIDELDR